MSDNSKPFHFTPSTQGDIEQARKIQQQFNPQEAPEGYKAIRKMDVSNPRGKNWCSFCDYRNDCNKKHPHRVICAPYYRIDNNSVIFKKAIDK